MKPTFTGILLRRKCGLETYQVVVRNVVVHEFMSLEFAEAKLRSYESRLRLAA